MTSQTAFPVWWRMFVASGICFGCIGNAGAEPGLAGDDLGGRIYWGDAPTDITAEIGQSAMHAPASRFACASCHGRDGLGGGDAGVSIPAITIASLEQGNSRRPAYNSSAIALALRNGIDSAGRRLDTSMPRYALSDTQAAALIAYLGEVEAKSRSGVSDTRIVFGVLAPDDREAARVMVLEALRATTRPVIYARQIDFEIIPYDPDPEKLAAILGRAEIFALAMPVLDGGSIIVDAARHAGVPIVAPWGPTTGFENPLDIRAVEAGLKPREKAIEAKVEELKSVYGESQVMALQGKPPAGISLGRAVVGTLDELGPYSETLKERQIEVFLLDTRFPATSQPRRRDVERQAEVAVRLVSEALRIGDTNPTRAGFMKAFDSLSLKIDSWPALDYRSNSLTGTDAVEFIHLGATTER